MINKANWVDARKTCKTYSMKLVTLETYEEDQALRYELSMPMTQFLIELNLTLAPFFLTGNHVSYSFWTSGTDAGSLGQFYWAESGTSVGLYNNWASGEPNGRSTSCLQLWGAEDLRWDDVPCDSKLPFICEAIECGQ